MNVTENVTFEMNNCETAVSS